MGTICDDTIGGYNSFIEQQKTIPGECLVSLMMFDHEFENPYEKVPLQDVKPLNRQTYVPRGSTALLDAIGVTLDKLEAREEKPERTLVVIITDGEENSSKEYTNVAIKKMIKSLRKSKRYEFIFLGANIDSFAVAQQYGMSVNNSINYTASAEGVTLAFANVNDSAVMYRNATAGDDTSDIMKKASEKNK